MKTLPGKRGSDRSDERRKTPRLTPVHKSGKERHSLYSRLHEDEEEESFRLRKRESVFDYFDDGEEERQES